MKTWTTKDSLDLYNIPRWGQGFFDANDEGHLVVTPAGPGLGGIDLHELVRELQGQREDRVRP